MQKHYRLAYNTDDYSWLSYHLLLTCRWVQEKETPSGVVDDVVLRVPHLVPRLRQVGRAHADEEDAAEEGEHVQGAPVFGVVRAHDFGRQ